MKLSSWLLENLVSLTCRKIGESGGPSIYYCSDSRRSFNRCRSPWIRHVPHLNLAAAIRCPLVLQVCYALGQIKRVVTLYLSACQQIFEPVTCSMLIHAQQIDSDHRLGNSLRSLTLARVLPGHGQATGFTSPVPVLLVVTHFVPGDLISTQVAVRTDSDEAADRVTSKTRARHLKILSVSLLSVPQNKHETAVLCSRAPRPAVPKTQSLATWRDLRCLKKDAVNSARQRTSNSIDGIFLAVLVSPGPNLTYINPPRHSWWSVDIMRYHASSWIQSISWFPKYNTLQCNTIRYNASVGQTSSVYNSLENNTIVYLYLYSSRFPWLASVVGLTGRHAICCQK